MEIKAAVLAIGNEVVEGQITNRNGAWLSQELSKIGVQSVFHLTCRDQPTEILQSLDFLNSHCDLILISGGLGPTKDDLTRQTMARWLKVDLELNQQLWDEIQSKLKSRNLTIRDGHKNQALLPAGSAPLANSVGVAPGFFAKANGVFLASLPGPPGELHSMFHHELLPLIIKHLQPQKEKTLYTWACLGAPESEIAHIADSLLGSELDIGYRLHRPYVEVKLWLTQKEFLELKPRIKKFEEKIQPWFVSHKISTIHENFHHYLSQFQYVFVIDQLTTGLLLEKLKEHKSIDNLRYQCFEHSAYRYFKKEEVQQIISHMMPHQNNQQLFYSLFPASDYSAWVTFNSEIIEIEIPHRFKINTKYGEHFAIEKSFLIKQNG